MRFRDHNDPLNPIQQAVAKNFDYLADQAGESVALSYLARVQGPRINNTAMAQILGDVHLINDYVAGGQFGTPYTLDSADTFDKDGNQIGFANRTLRVGRARPNWMKKLDSDPRPRYDLPVNIAGL